MSAVLILAATACSDAVAPPTPASVDLDPSVLSFTFLGETRQLSAVVRDASGRPIPAVERTWRSEDGSVATVTSTGLVTASGPGTTRIVVVAGGASASVSVAVVQEPAGLSLAPDSVVLSGPGDTRGLEATVTDRAGWPIEGASLAWSVDDPDVAAVDAGGAVTGVGAGSTWARATAGPGVDSVWVRVGGAPDLVGVGSTSTEAQVMSTVRLTARVTEPGGGGFPGALVTWSTGTLSGSITSAPETVSGQDGLVSADWTLGPRADVQQAWARLETSEGTRTVAFTVTATPGPAATVVFAADSVLLSGLGEEILLAPTVLDAWGNPTGGSPSWSSSDAAVATVGSDGLAQAIGAGTTWIHATVEAASDSIQVTMVRRGAITVTFDDGWRSVYENAWPVIQEFPGLRPNVGVYTDAIGWDGYLTEAHLDEMHQAGWSMVSHSVTHDSLTTLGPAELDLELRASQEWLDARGYRGSHIFVAPYHDFTDAERTAVAQYYVAARGMSATETVPETLVEWMPSAPFHLTGLEAALLPYSTVEGRDRLRMLLQRTVDEGAFVDVFFHQIPVDRVDAFRAALGVLWEFRDRVLPYHELFPLTPRVVR